MFVSSPWMPLRAADSQCGETVVFPLRTAFKNEDNACPLLHGVWHRHTTNSSVANGVILYCHEYNGNQNSATPVLSHLQKQGFDVLSIDFRDHGKSAQCCSTRSTPWVSTYDLEDVMSAIDYIESQPMFAKIGKIGIMGLSKGATIAATAAGSDPRIDAVALDSPTPEGRLFEKNCWESLSKKRHYKTTYFSKKYAALVGKAFVFTAICPFLMLKANWTRYVLGYWCGCRFVNTWAHIKKIQKPVFIIHGGKDEYCCTDKIWAFRQRMQAKTDVWIVPNAQHGGVAVSDSEEYGRRLGDFFTDALAV